MTKTNWSIFNSSRSQPCAWNGQKKPSCDECRQRPRVCGRCGTSHMICPFYEQSNKPLKLIDFDGNRKEEQSAKFLPRSLSHAPTSFMLNMARSSGAALSMPRWMANVSESNAQASSCETGIPMLQREEQYISPPSEYMPSIASETLWLSWRAFFEQYGNFFYTHVYSDWVKECRVQKEIQHSRHQPSQNIQKGIRQVDDRQPRNPTYKRRCRGRRRLNRPTLDSLSPRSGIAKRTGYGSYHWLSGYSSGSPGQAASLKREKTESQTAPIAKTDVIQTH